MELTLAIYFGLVYFVGWFGVRYLFRSNGALPVGTWWPVVDCRPDEEMVPFGSIDLPDGRMWWDVADNDLHLWSNIPLQPPPPPGGGME